MHHDEGTDYRSYPRSIKELLFDLFCTYEEYNYGGIPNLSILAKYYPDKTIYIDGDYDEIRGDIEEARDIKEVGKRDFYDLMPLILLLEIFLLNYNYAIKRGNGLTEHEIKFNIKRHYPLKESTIGIYSVYLLCWVYILVISIPTFTMSNIDVIYLQSFQDNLNPFANVIINLINTCTF